MTDRYWCGRCRDFHGSRISCTESRPLCRRAKQVNNLPRSEGFTDYGGANMREQTAPSNELSAILSARWQTLEEFTETPNEGWCWIAYKGRVLEAYHDHKGLFRFSSFSENVYLTECITAAQAMVAPAMPALRSE